MSLHRDLIARKYAHGGYQAFKINDPKPRQIHKAIVRDRLLHHAIYRVLYPYFDKKFVFDSYSCRNVKGTHRAINRFREYARQASLNHTKTVWVLKCDIRKFFANIDHKILFYILKRHITDDNTLYLLHEVINSFHVEGKTGVGLPLGNLTSQLFVNIYMNIFDHFIKRELKIKRYIRYADDFVILHENKEYLEKILPKMSLFLDSKLKLLLHPNKVFIKTFASRVDFLGWVHFPHCRTLRTSTKNRMFKNIKIKSNNKPTINSYRALLRHGNAYKLDSKLNIYYNTNL